MKTKKQPVETSTPSVVTVEDKKDKLSTEEKTTSVETNSPSTKETDEVSATVPAAATEYTLEYLLSLNAAERIGAILEMVICILKFNPKEKGYGWCSDLIHYLTGEPHSKIEKWLPKVVETAPNITEEQWRQMLLVLRDFSRTPQFASRKERYKLYEDTLDIAGQVLTTAFKLVENDYKYMRQAVETTLQAYLPLNEIQGWIRQREAASITLSVPEYWNAKREVLSKLAKIRKTN